MTTRRRMLLASVAVVTLTASCTGDGVLGSTSQTSPAPAETESPDGALDCDNEMTFTMQASFLPDAQGESTPGEALRVFLSQWTPRFGGEVAVMGETVASLVVDDRERVLAFASAAPAGGWLVATTHHCEGYGL